MLNAARKQHTKHPLKGKPMTLTRDDIAALKRATSISFSHHQGHGFIRPHLRSDRHPHYTFTARQQILFPKPGSLSEERTREIAVDATLQGYTGTDGRSWFGSDRPNVTAFYLMHHRSADWDTITAPLRAGESIRLWWKAGNNTQNHDSVGFYCDELRLVVMRDDVAARQYLISVQVGPDNSARMIREHG